MQDTQTRTLPLGDGKRTTVKFDPVTWRAIDLIAERAGMRWTQWVRKLIDANPDAGKMHAMVRAAAIDGLLAEQVIAERAEQMTSGNRPVLLEGCVSLNDEQLGEELALGHPEGDAIDMVGFTILAGLDQHDQPTVWVRNGLRNGTNVAITLPFTANEVASKRGAFQ